MHRRKALLIAGPTASGKSGLAMRAAERFGGIVINADSMAVYRDLSILTGRPDTADLARVPHRLYGHRDGADPYSVGLWLTDAEAEIRRAREAGALPIVVGGTGLYFKALTRGLSDIPAVPDHVRATTRLETEDVPAEALHARLAAIDPLTASGLRSSDRQRIVRAIEVFTATGRPLATFQGRRGPAVLQMSDVLGIVVMPDRDLLRQRIDRRFDAMMGRGALDEVDALRGRGLDPALPAMRALGVPPLLAHLDGALGLDEAIARSKAQTRAYAKRQVTFARHQLPDFAWWSPDDAEAWLDTLQPS